MAKKRSKRGADKSPAQQSGTAEKKRGGSSKSSRERRKLPNWPLLVLAGIGAALAAFLTISTWAGEALPYCTEGSSCDLVQSSRWGTLFGSPIAFWGLLNYLALIWVALRLRNTEWHFKLSWTLSLTGVAVSVYLTAISAVVIEALCVYCLTSLGIMLAILAVVAMQSPKGLAEFTWPGWLLQTGGLAAVVVVALHLNWSGVFDPAEGEEDPYLRDLAIHLNDQDARFFGAFWCPNCDRQKEAFEASASRLPYIECSPNGRNGPRAALCSANNITAFPTWIIGDDRYTGVLRPRELARYSGFRPPADSDAR